MGDMSNGGAPRAKGIFTHLTTLAGAVANGLMKINLRNSSGTEIGTADNPVYVDIGGNVPDKMDLDRVGGTATPTGAGAADAGTLRVINATDDPNLAGMLAQLDITLSALRDALQGTGSKDLTTVETDIEAILTQTDVLLSTRASEATLAAQLDITQSALRDAMKGAGSRDFTTLETDIEAILAQLDVDLSTRASEATLAAQLDITQSALRDALKGAGGKDLSTIETDIEAILAQTDIALSALRDAITGGTTLATVNTTAGTLAKESGGNLDTLVARADIAQSALRDALLGASTRDLSTIQTVLESIQTAAAAIQTAAEVMDDWDDTNRAAVIMKADPVFTRATGAAAIAATCTPGAKFYLDAVLVHFSAIPTTSENLTISLDAGAGAEYDTIFKIADPSALTDTAGDVAYVPATPVLFDATDVIAVAYANTDTRTYGVTFVTRLA